MSKETIQPTTTPGTLEDAQRQHKEALPALIDIYGHNHPQVLILIRRIAANQKIIDQSNTPPETDKM